MKDKLYIFFYDEAGCIGIQFWKELSMEEIDELVEEYGSLREAALVEAVGVEDNFMILTETDLEIMRTEINNALK